MNAGEKTINCLELGKKGGGGGEESQNDKVLASICPPTKGIPGAGGWEECLCGSQMAGERLEEHKLIELI